jgi:signal transduction histidine kinase
MAEARARRRIATSLHDIIGQDLALARIKLGLLSKKLHENEDRELLKSAHKLMNKVIKGVRSLTHLIHPPILQSSGLEAAMQWLARQMGEEYGLAVEFRDDHREKPISREMQTHLYFAVRELLINVVKHAGTNRASVSLFRENGAYHIVVEDWGAGFNANNGIDKKAESNGFGLFNIRRRTMYFGGILEIDSSPGNGTRVTIKLPLESDED